MMVRTSSIIAMSVRPTILTAVSAVPRLHNDQGNKPRITLAAGTTRISVTTSTRNQQKQLESHERFLPSELLLGILAFTIKQISVQNIAAKSVLNVLLSFFFLFVILLSNSCHLGIRPSKSRKYLGNRKEKQKHPDFWNLHIRGFLLLFHFHSK